MFRSNHAVSIMRHSRVNDCMNRLAPRRQFQLAALASMCLTLTPLAHAQGGPPMLTDDPGTTDVGRFEINIAVSTEQASEGHESESPLIDINYGLVDRVEIKYEAAYLRARDADGVEKGGVGNSKVGLKWRFLDGGETGWNISFYPQIEFRTPGSHSARRGLTASESSWDIPLQFQKDFGAVGVSFDVGRVLHDDDPDEWFGGVAVGYPVSESVEVAAELRINSVDGSHGTVVLANVGARWAFAERYSLMASVGRDVSNTTGDRTSFIGYLGLQLRL